jgi:hypothetical protein
MGPNATFFPSANDSNRVRGPSSSVSSESDPSDQELGGGLLAVGEMRRRGVLRSELQFLLDGKEDAKDAKDGILDRHLLVFMREARLETVFLAP